MPKAKSEPQAVTSLSHIGTLKADPENARKHNPTNVGMIEQSLKEVGAARSIVIDEDNVVLAGNATVEAAGAAGMEKVLVVEADGNTVVAVRRTGLTPEQKKRLALFDNRTAELATWDTAVLEAMHNDDSAILDGIFSDRDLTRLFGGSGDAKFAETGQEGMPSLGNDVVPGIPDSTVRMQQIFLNNETFPLFVKLIETLKERWRLATVTDVIMEALQRCEQST